MKIGIFFLLISISLSVKGQWMQTKFPASGTINAYCINGTSIFAGTDQGVFISTNNGLEWVATNSGLKDLTVLSLASNGTEIYAGTLKGGIFTSINNGKDWIENNTGFSPFYPVNALLINSTDLYAGTKNGGVFRSRNKAPWSPMNSGLNSLFIHSLCIKDSFLLAGTNSGVFHSSNNGATWTISNQGLETAGHVHAFIVKGSNVFAGTISGGVALSKDQGKSWSFVNNGISNDMALGFASNDTDLYVCTYGNGVFKTSNNGTSWTADNFGLSNLNVTAIVLQKKNLIAGSDLIYILNPLTGLSDINDSESRFNVYPNPSNGQITLYDSDKNRNTPVNLTITNLLGKVLYHEGVDLNAPCRIDLTSFQSGVYFLVIDLEGRKIFKKVILQY